MFRYSLLQRLLHWTVAVLTIGVLAGGIVLWWYGFQGVTETFGPKGRDLIYNLHKTFGVVILGLMLIRIVVKIAHGTPDYAVPLTRFERRASASVHHLLYICVTAMPILGWLATGASGFPVEFFGWTLPPILEKNQALGGALFLAHGIVGALALILIVVHVLAAIRHGAVKQDRVLSRMV